METVERRNVDIIALQGVRYKNERTKFFKEGGFTYKMY